jgi:hypothetical protein
MRGNIKSFEKSFTHADVVALAERTLKRFGGDRNKAGRYARSMENRYESSKWAQVVEVLATSGRHHATRKKSSLRPSYDTSTGAGQKRLMQESVGLEYVPPQRITAASGDYGADPIGPDDAGVFRWRMVPSGDIVDKAEHDRRLGRGAKRHHATKKSPAQLQREIDEALAGSGSSSPFEAAKAESALIEKEVDAASEALRAFPRGPMGLTPDAVAATSEYRSANARYQKAFARQRAFNAVFVKRFAKELRAERSQRYGRSS